MCEECAGGGRGGGFQKLAPGGGHVFLPGLVLRIGTQDGARIGRSMVSVYRSFIGRGDGTVKRGRFATIITPASGAALIQVDCHVIRKRSARILSMTFVVVSGFDENGAEAISPQPRCLF